MTDWRSVDHPFALFYFPADAEGNRKSSFHDLRKDQTALVTRFFNSSSKPYAIASQDEHQNLVANAIEAIHLHGITKIVVSRIEEIKNKGQDLQLVIEKLKTAYPFALVYVLKTTDGELWIGATPEILIQRTDGKCKVMSLAGSQRYLGGDPQAVTWGAKELAEQEIVTSYILKKLRHIGIQDIEVIGPYTHVAGPVVHLRSDIEFEHRTNLLSVISALHPTPAVCGYPSERAYQWIEENESHNRGFYTGLIGTISHDGDAAVFVNLRCMKVEEDAFLLFVGGGVNSMSVPEQEWNETKLKAEVLSNILQSA